MPLSSNCGLYRPNLTAQYQFGSILQRTTHSGKTGPSQLSMGNESGPVGPMAIGGE